MAMKNRWGLNSISYENVDPSSYLDLSGRGLNVEKMYKMMSDIADDVMMRHINLSNNITAEEVEQPSRMMKLFTGLKYIFNRNRTLTAIDLAGNHLFDNTPHPSNEHVVNYLEELANLLCESKIRCLDLSNNNVVGKTGRQHRGLAILAKNFLLKKKAKAFICRFNGLHSQSFAVVADGFGVYSSMTYLDLSDNRGGLGSFNEANSTGIATLSKHLSQTLHVKVLKLARNHLTDECFQHLGNAISCMHTLQFIDLSGNLCTVLGAEALKEAMLALTPFAGTRCVIETYSKSYTNRIENIKIFMQKTSYSGRVFVNWI